MHSWSSSSFQDHQCHLIAADHHGHGQGTELIHAFGHPPSPPSTGMVSTHCEQSQPGGVPQTDGNAVIVIPHFPVRQRSAQLLFRLKLSRGTLSAFQRADSVVRHWQTLSGYAAGGPIFQAAGKLGTDWIVLIPPPVTSTSQVPVLSVTVRPQCLPGTLILNIDAKWQCTAMLQMVPIESMTTEGELPLYWYSIAPSAYSIGSLPMNLPIGEIKYLAR